MVISQLLGGLGNQFFQYAFGFAKAKNLGTEFFYDSSRFENYKVWDFKLDYFDISFPAAGDRLVTAHLPLLNLKRLKYVQLSKLEVVKEPTFTFSEKIFSESGSGYYEGYWQTEKYFKEYASEIKNEFKLKKSLIRSNDLILERIKSSNSVSLHVRRGDYASNLQAQAVHGLMGMDYYKAAIAYVKGQVVDPVFFVFSDEIDWVKQNFKFEDSEVYFVEGNSVMRDIEEFELMLNCKHSILANSTFSWWAAWLGEEKEISSKLAIAPKIWFQNPRMDSRDLIPERWVRL